MSWKLDTSGLLSAEGEILTIQGKEVNNLLGKASRAILMIE